MKGRLISFVLSLVLVLCSVPAFAATTPDAEPTNLGNIAITDNEVIQLRETMTKDGIDLGKQNSIIDKIQRGEMLDCDNPEIIATIPKDALTLKKGEIKKTYVFPDGSYRKMYMIPITPKNKDILLEAIGDKEKVDSLLEKKSSRYAIQSYSYHDMWVQYGTPVIQGGFSVNFRLSTSNDSIIYYNYGPNVWCFGFTSDPATWQLSIPAKYENQSGYCEAKLRFVVVGQFDQTTKYTHFYISNGSYWADFT